MAHDSPKGDKNPTISGRDVAKFHLTTYYYSVELAGMIIPVLVGLAATFFPEYLEWLTNHSRSQDLMVGVLFLFGLLDATLLILHELTNKNIFFNINRYCFVVLFIFAIMMTGGVNSSLTFLLIFPFIVSLVYLDKRMTRNIGIFLTILFASVIFTHPTSEIDWNLITKHFTQTGIIGIIAFLMYRTVVETLRQNYEKEQTARRLEELLHIDHLKADFLSVAQHRLRTPLSGVRWSLESLVEESDPQDKKRQVLSDSLQRVKDSIAIVDDMLRTVEDPTGEALFLNYERFDLVSVIQSIVKELTFVQQNNDNTMKLNLPDKLSIKADKAKIYAALSNVVDNACRYTKNGIVTISLSNKGSDLVCEVVDNGIGISPGDLPNVFDRLHRGSNAVAVDPDESGIGLYVSKKIIEMHGGTIKVESILNNGTKATIQMPVGI